MQRWKCTVCDYVYDPAQGDPVNEVPPEVPFDELLEDWHCPICRSGKCLFTPCLPDTGAGEGQGRG